MKQIDDWILSQKIDWLKEDSAYWKDIFKRAINESHTDLPHPSSNWIHLCRDLGLDEDLQDLWVGATLNRVTPTSSRWEPPQKHVQWIKNLRFLIRNQYKTRNQRIHLSDYPWYVEVCLRRAIDKLTNGLDNVRFAQCSKKSEMKRYWRKRAQGCCGFADKYVWVGWNKYLVGCNYGH